MSILRTWNQRATNCGRRHTFYSNLRENPKLDNADTYEERAAKIKRINDNFTALEKIKKDKVAEILNFIDLFDGKISLTEILNHEIPFITDLAKAKEERNTETQNLIMKRQQEQAARAANEQAQANAKAKREKSAMERKMRKGGK